MKQILLILLMLIFNPLSIFAISLNEIESNPSRYIIQIPISKRFSFVSYIDIQSIKTYSDSPSYKALEYKSYMVNYAKVEIYDYKNTVVFDSKFSSYSKSKIFASDYGVYLRMTSGSGYAFDGSSLNYKINSFYFDPLASSMKFDELLYSYKCQYNHSYIKKF